MGQETKQLNDHLDWHLEIIQEIFKLLLEIATVNTECIVGCTCERCSKYWEVEQLIAKLC